VAVVAVVTSAPPLVEGGHLVIARALERALVEAGHRAGIVTTPSNRFGRQASAYLANYLTDVGMTGSGERVDRVITLRFPSYAVRHPHQVCWLNHTMREYYDQWDRFSASLSPQGRLKESVRRRLIRAADSYLLKHHARAVFAQSRTVQERLARWNGVASEVLYPPPPPRAYRCDGYGDFLLFISRLAPLKRADLVLGALARPEAKGVYLVIAGDGEERPRLEQMSRELGLEGRVRFAGRVTDDALVELVGRCRGVVFVPADEDYGFVTVEAFASGKAVITCTDSGGPAELVRDGENGFVVQPSPDALARACARLTTDAALAERLGSQARADVASLTWAGVVEKLVGGTDGRP
jgi:glycosyltransferase involved in cell wall biosynthesis